MTLFQKGDPRINRNGRPPGSLSFATLFKKAIKNVAEANKINPDDLEVQLLERGIREAHKGSFKFYKDTMDRVHGKAQEFVDHTTGGDKMVFMPSEILKKHGLDDTAGIDSSTEADSEGPTQV